MPYIYYYYSTGESWYLFQRTGEGRVDRRDWMHEYQHASRRRPHARVTPPTHSTNRARRWATACVNRYRRVVSPTKPTTTVSDRKPLLSNVVTVFVVSLSIRLK